MHGGFRGLLHNEVVALLGSACREAGYRDVAYEHVLQPLQGEGGSFRHKSAVSEDGARTDVRVLGFWTKWRQAHFDVTAFSPFAKTYRNTKFESVYRQLEKRKQRKYSERIRQVEHGDFSPLVFAIAGGMGPQASCVVKRIGQKLAEKKGLPISVVLGWLNCRISFAMLRSSLVCLRGSRPYRPRNDDFVVDLAVSEARIERG